MNVRIMMGINKDGEGERGQACDQSEPSILYAIARVAYSTQAIPSQPTFVYSCTLLYPNLHSIYSSSHIYLRRKPKMLDFHRLYIGGTPGRLHRRHDGKPSLSPQP